MAAPGRTRGAQAIASAAAAQGRQREAARRSCAAAWARRGLTDISFDAADAWRPDESAQSRMRFALQYGWMAYSAGFRKTAMIYGCKAIRIGPARREAWRLLAISLLRPPRKAGAAPMAAGVGQ